MKGLCLWPHLEGYKADHTLSFPLT